MMNVRAIAVAAGIVSLFILSGCGRKPYGKENKSKITLNYVYWGDISEIALNTHWIRSFEKKHPGIKVNMIHTSEVETKILTMVAAGVPPDVMYAWPQVLQDFASKGIYLPLNAFIKRDGIDQGKWFPQILKAYKYKDKIYGLPRGWNPYVLYYNKNLFDEAGVPYPDESWTWQTVIKYGRKLTKRDREGRIEQFAISNVPYQIFVWSMGGKFFDREGKPSYDGPKTIEGFQLARDLIWKYKISPTPQQLKQNQSAEDMFLTGRVAMFALGMWAVPRFRTIKKFKWDIAVMPRGKVRKTMLVTAGWAISSATKHPQQAWDLVKYLSGDEAQTYQMKIFRDPSGLIDILKKYMFYEPQKPPQNRGVFLKSIKFGRFLPVFPGSMELIAKINQDIDNIFVLKHVDVPKMCKSIQREAEGLRGNLYY